MKGSCNYLPRHRLSLSFWILSICIYFASSQAPTAPPGPSLMELSSTVQTLRLQFEGFRSYVETELAKLSGSVSACCTGGGGNPMYRPIDLQLTKTKVDVVPNSNMVEYMLQYKAIKDPIVIWKINGEPAISTNGTSGNVRYQKPYIPDAMNVAVTDEGIIAKTFTDGKGTATLRVAKDRKIVASIILDQVTNVITFRENPNVTASMLLKPTNFYVDSGAHGSFSYTQGKPMNILVSSPKYYAGFSTLANEYQWSFWMANTTAQPPRMEEYPQVREMNGRTVRVGPIRTLKKIQHPTDLKIVYELMTNQGDYDGILIFSKFYQATDSASVITDFTEMRYVFVSRKDRFDPFPIGFISFVRRDPATKACKLNQTCSISCHAVGVVPEGIQLFKISSDRLLLELNLPRLDVREPYMLYSHFAIKRMGEKDEGEYICSAYTRTSRTDIKTTLLLSEPVEFINASTGIEWAPNMASVTVSCAAKGRPLPNIRLFENYVTKVEMINSQSVFIDRGVERLPGGEYVATVRATIQLPAMTHLWRVICLAQNQFETQGTDHKIKNEPLPMPPLWGQPFGQSPASQPYMQGGPNPAVPGPYNPQNPNPQYNPTAPGPYNPQSPNPQYNPTAPGPYNPQSPNPQYNPGAPFPQYNPGAPNPQYNAGAPPPPPQAYNQGPPTAQYQPGPPNPQYNQAAANSPYSPAASNPQYNPAAPTAGAPTV